MKKNHTYRFDTAQIDQVRHEVELDPYQYRDVTGFIQQAIQEKLERNKKIRELKAGLEDLQGVKSK